MYSPSCFTTLTPPSVRTNQSEHNRTKAKCEEEMQRKLV